MPAAPDLPEHPAPIPPAPRARRRGEETAERILDAAEGLFAERGFAGTTLRDVAARVGIRNPSVYNHFPSKESLYRAVLERGMGPVLQALSEAMEPGVESWRNPNRLVSRVMGLLAQRPSLPRLILHETLSGGERLTPMLGDWIGPAFARAREMIEATPGARHWAPDQIPLLALALTQILLGCFTLVPLYEGLGAEERLSEQALARQTRFLSDVAARLLGDASPAAHAPHSRPASVPDARPTES